MDPKALTTRDDFEYWLADMDDALARFMAILTAEVVKALDYSPASLSILEDWLLKKYPNTKAMLAPAEAQTTDGAARYIGETFRKTVGGHWDIVLDDPKNVYFGVPILTGFEEKPTPICPLALATACCDRRTGGFIKTVLENTERRVVKTRRV